MNKSLFILTLMIFVTSASTAPLCTCSQLSQQADCIDLGCNWSSSNSTCSDSKTSTTPSQPCTSYSDQVSCDLAPTCAWTNSQVCSVFTKCSDYTVSSEDAYFCNKKDSTCAPGSVSNGYVTCTSGTLSCSSITDQTVCNSGLNTNTYQVCFWNTKCTSYDVSTCSIITVSDLCTKLGCVYNNSICSAPLCYSMTTLADCHFIRGDSLLSATACTWNSTVCVELDASTLNATTCYPQTGGTYEWNGSSCQACTSSYTMIVSVVSLLLMIVL